MRKMLLSGMAVGGLLTACGPGPIDAQSKCVTPYGQTYYSARPSDCGCLGQFVAKADKYNRDHGFYSQSQLEDPSLTIWFSKHFSLEEDEVDASKDWNFLWGLYDPNDDYILVSHGGWALAHELLHRGRVKQVGRTSHQEAAHENWDTEGLKTATDLFIFSGSSASCEIPMKL